jgi:hypothetical protein
MASLGGQQTQARIRQAIIERGPDAGRQADHLKMRTLGPGAAEAVRMAEGMGIGTPAAGQITQTDGNGATLLSFVLGASALGSEDVL